MFQQLPLSLGITELQLFVLFLYQLYKWNTLILSEKEFNIYFIFSIFSYIIFLSKSQITNFTSAKKAFFPPYQVLTHRFPYYCGNSIASIFEAFIFVTSFIFLLSLIDRLIISQYLKSNHSFLSPQFSFSVVLH